MLKKMLSLVLLFSANSYAAFELSESELKEFEASVTQPSEFRDAYWKGFMGGNSSNQIDSLNSTPFTLPQTRYDSYAQPDKTKLATALVETAVRVGRGLFEGLKTNEGKQYAKNGAIGAAVVTTAIGVAGGSVAFGQNHLQNQLESRASDNVNEEEVTSEQEIFDRFAEQMREELNELRESDDFQVATPAERVAMQRELLDRIEEERKEVLKEFRQDGKSYCTIM